MSKTCLKSCYGHVMNHDMISNELCHEGINTPITCHDSVIPQSETRLSEGISIRRRSGVCGLTEREELQDSVIPDEQSFVSECEVSGNVVKLTTAANAKELQDSNNRLSKSDWWYLVNQLTEWRVFNPRAVIKKNPAAAWRVMNLCKDNCVRVPGAYFTACFRKELEKDKLLSFQKTLEKRMRL